MQRKFSLFLTISTVTLDWNTWRTSATNLGSRLSSDCCLIYRLRHCEELNLYKIQMQLIMFDMCWCCLLRGSVMIDRPWIAFIFLWNVLEKWYVVTDLLSVPPVLIQGLGLSTMFFLHSSDTHSVSSVWHPWSQIMWEYEIYKVLLSIRRQMETGMSLFLKHFHSASSPVAVTYIAPCISHTLWQMSTCSKTDFLLLQGYSLVPCCSFMFFFISQSHLRIWKKRRKTKSVPSIPVSFWCLNRSLKECLWRKDVWNIHSLADTHTHTLCWQCVLWVPGSSRGLSCCLDIWLLRQIWLIWDGRGVQRTV